MRRHVKDKKLYNHVTKTFTDMNVKRICNVPKRYFSTKSIFSAQSAADMPTDLFNQLIIRPPVGQPHPDPEPFYDHRDLPKELSPWCLSDPNSRGQLIIRTTAVDVLFVTQVVTNTVAAAAHRGWPGLYGRLDYQSYFQTALTEVCPMGKQGKVLHPYQSRCVVYLELWPDFFLYKRYSSANSPPG